MTRRSLAITFLLVGTMVRPGSAHEARPGYLEVRQTGPETFDILWKVPAVGDRRLSIQPKFPQNCRLTSEVTRFFTADSFAERSSILCQGSLGGRRIVFNGLEATLTDVLVQATLLDGGHWNAIARSSQPWIEFTGSKSLQEVAGSYFLLGIKHILFGADHLMFVFGLLLIVKDRWMLLKTITAFTIAHSITLAIATLGYASLPLDWLDAAIALSIFFLGPEIVRSWRGQTSLAIRHPWVVAFAFGLLHGFGFASAMVNAGLSRHDLPLALLSFNLGVEAGQIGFVLLVLSLERSFRQLEVRWPRWAEYVPGYAVGTLGAFWAIQRTAVLLGAIR